MIDTKRLRPATYLPHSSAQAPDEAYVDRERGWCIQVYRDRTPACNGTPWEGTVRVAVKHTRATNKENYFKRGYGLPVTWDDLQAIKDHFWPEQIAVEVYPPHDSIVDVAEMRWLWVLPKGAILPFNLQDSKDILES